MRTIIKITKQEAIEAYIKYTKLHPDSIIEIEENAKFPTYYTGTQYLVGNGGLPLPSCPLCGKYGQHVCVT